MREILSSLAGYLPTLVASAAIIGAAVLVSVLSSAPRRARRQTTQRICRVGLKPARIEVSRAKGSWPPLSVSVRTVDRDHVWVRVEGPSDITVRAEGDETLSRAGAGSDQRAAFTG